MNNIYSQFSIYNPELKETFYLINHIYVVKYEENIINDTPELYILRLNEYYIYEISKRFL